MGKFLLTDIIRQMCAGNNPEKEIQQFIDNCESLTGDEITAVFNRMLEPDFGKSYGETQGRYGGRSPNWTAFICVACR